MDDEEVYLVDVPTDFFAYYCADNPVFRVVSVTEEFVTIMFPNEEVTGAFERIYAHFGFYNLVMYLRLKEPIKAWSEDYIKYRYGLDMIFGNYGY